jgi:hypothetical protein
VNDVARASGVLSPNDVRQDEDWPASTNPSADSILPLNTSAAAAGAPVDDDAPADPPKSSDDRDAKIVSGDAQSALLDIAAMYDRMAKRAAEHEAKHKLD